MFPDADHFEPYWPRDSVSALTHRIGKGVTASCVPIVHLPTVSRSTL